MLLIPCPFCGPRAEIEFAYAGEAHIQRPPDPAATDDATWTDFLYNRTNPKGPHAERWRHAHGCNRFFTIARNTVTDELISPLPSREGPGVGMGLGEPIPTTHEPHTPK